MRATFSCVLYRRDPPTDRQVGSPCRHRNVPGLHGGEDGGSMAENLKQRLQRALVYEVTWTGYSGFTATVNTASTGRFNEHDSATTCENVVGLGDSRLRDRSEFRGQSLQTSNNKRASVRPKLKRDAEKIPSIDIRVVPGGGKGLVSTSC